MSRFTSSTERDERLAGNAAGLQFTGYRYLCFIAPLNW